MSLVSIGDAAILSRLRPGGGGLSLRLVTAVEVWHENVPRSRHELLAIVTAYIFGRKRQGAFRPVQVQHGKSPRAVGIRAKR